MDPDDQDFFVIRTIEYADATALRQVRRRPPQEMVRAFLWRWRLECVRDATLGMDARHHVLDDAVLAGSVPTLQHDEHGPLALCVKPFLHLFEARNRRIKRRFHVLDVGR